MLPSKVRVTLMGAGFAAILGVASPLNNIARAETVTCGSAMYPIQGKTWGFYLYVDTGCLEETDPFFACSAVSFEVDYDDGSGDSTVKPGPGGEQTWEHTYPSNGLYHPSMEADDAIGRGCGDFENITVAG
jgi:hypothetical protein